MITPTLLGLIQNALPSGYNPNLPGALVAVSSLSDEITCDRAGWVFTAQSVDGGPPPTPWGISYLDYSGNVSSGPTTEAGLALVYNIDSQVTAITVAAENFDGGAGTNCAPAPNTGFSNQVPVFPPASNTIAFYPIIVP